MIFSFSIVARAQVYVEKKEERGKLVEGNIHCPRIAINFDGKKANPVIYEIQASRFDYEKNVDDFVEQLNEIYKNPKDKIDHNIKNAIHFFRIGDNFAPKYQELFYYVAAMEHLLLGRHDRNVL